MTPLEFSKKYKTLLNKYGVNTPLRLSHLCAQLLHESGLKPIQENLNYSEQGLLKTFKKYFTAETAKKYARKPKDIANKVYANRMGNSTESSGDGWKYSGKGLIQITGRDNYKALSKDTGIDYVSKPELLLNESDSVIAALWYWNKINGNKHADNDNLDAISDLINIGRMTPKVGDAIGYENRKEHLQETKNIFGA